MNLENRITYETKEQFMERVEKNESVLDHRSVRPTDEIINITYDITKDSPKQGELRCKNIHEWIVNNFPYKSGKDHLYTTAKDTFSKKNGNCVDLSYLFLSMSLIAGNYTTRVAITTTHCFNYLSNTDSYVDCTMYNGFGIIPNKKHYILPTQETIWKHFDGYCENLNRKNYAEAKRIEKSIMNQSVNPGLSLNVYANNFSRLIFGKILPYSFAAAATLSVINPSIAGPLAPYIHTIKNESMALGEKVRDNLNIKSFSEMREVIDNDINNLRYKIESTIQKLRN